MAMVPVDDRPREKLARVGAEALGDNELIALVLGSGTRSRGALMVAHDVIDAAGGAQGLLRMGLDELCRVPGVGQSRAARLLADVCEKKSRHNAMMYPMPFVIVFTSVILGLV